MTDGLFCQGQKEIPCLLVLSRGLALYKQERRQCVFDVAHFAPFRRGWYDSPYKAVLQTPHFHEELRL